MDKNIKLGFWNYIKSGIMGREAVQDWKELGCNVAMSFDFDAEVNDKQEMLDILDECQAQGLQLIIRDKRTRFKRYAKRGEEAFRAGVREAYEDFGKHGATFGFFVGDEPNEEQVDAFIATLKIVQEEMPGLIPFGNLLPYWGSGDYAMLTSRSAEHFYGIVSRILKESNVPVIAYDHYSQCLQDNENQQAGIDGWFYDLDMYYKAAKEQGKDFYVTALCVGHWAYRVPTEDDFRWQISTALVHGARGVFWFHLYNLNGDSSYRNAPFYGDHFKRTETFTYLARQQDIFRQCYMEQFNKMELTDVYHTGHIYDPAKRFTSDEIIREINGEFTYPTIISYYKEFDSEERWVSIVNAHQRYANLIRLYFTCGESRVFWLAPGEIKLFKLSDVIKK
jgi:hypothetical protein